MKELVVISGKGGTGKTSLVASFAVLAEDVVLADCDVDASDLHLVLNPEILTEHPFSGGSRASINPDACIGCGRCKDICRFDAIIQDTSDDQGSPAFRVDSVACEGCGVCVWWCEEHAIDFGAVENGRWFHSDTRAGPMIHAQLGVAEENSGKLVSLVRREAKRVAQRDNRTLLMVDGSPGIGCPVIASITGADLVLVVTEPTLSGLHDLERVAELTNHFGIETVMCINKWDLNAAVTENIETNARQMGIHSVGRIRYDRAVTEAQVRRQALVEYTPIGAATDIAELWSQLLTYLKDLHSLKIL